MSTESKQRDMTSGVIWKGMLNFFFPICAGTLFQQLYNAVDAIIVGKYVGTAALAAVGGSPAVIVNLVISIFVSLTTGSSVIVSQLFGAGNHKELEKATGTAMAFFAVLGLGLTVILEPLAYQLLDVLKTPYDIREDAAEYLHIFFSGMVLLMLVNAQSGILRAVGDSRRPFLFMMAGCVVNIALDLLFVIRFQMGVAGVAWATVISIGINMALTTAALLRTGEPYRIRPRSVRIDRSMLKNMMRLGIPSALSGAMYGVSNAILQGTVNALGTMVVACWALTGKVDGVYYSCSNAAGAALTTFSGQNYGAKKTGRVMDGVRTAFRLFEPMTVLICAAILALSGYLLPLFTDDPEVIRVTQEILWYFVPFYFLWTIIELLSAVLRGCGVVRGPVVISGLGICLFRVIWVMTVCRIRLTLFTVSIVYAVSWAVTSAAMILYYRDWKKKLINGNIVE